MKNFNLLILSLLVFVFACNSDNKNLNEPDFEFSKYVTGFTRGEYLSSQSHFIIKFQKALNDTVKTGDPVSVEVFKFDPAVKGKAYWVNGRTIEFIPDKPLKNDEIYDIRIFLKNLLKDIPENFAEMKYQVKTMPQSYDAVKSLLSTYHNEMKYFKYQGTIITADAVANNKDIEKSLSVVFLDKPMKANWQHDETGKIHKFIIDSINRQEDSKMLEIKINGNKFGVDDQQSFSIRIPGINEFEVMSVNVTNGNNPQVTVSFSDPLLQDQNINGLIYIPDINTNLIIDGNHVKINFNKKISGEHKLHITAGIKNALGYKLKNSGEYDIVFTSEKPAVELIGNGVIMPSSDGLIIPFKAVSLSAIDLSVVQIFEDNVLFFLQENEMNGNSSLSRVGRLVFKKKIPLEKNIGNQGTWHTYKLDLSKYIEPQPGAIYRVLLGFRKEYSLYQCEGNNKTETISEIEYQKEVKDEMAKYDEQRYYWDWNYPDDFRWSERDNPCHNSYYTVDRFVSKNIFVSDFGITAKGTNANKYMVAVADLKTTDPVSGATVSFYNFQRQLMGAEKTDNDGLVMIQFDGKPYFVVVTKNDKKGYLRLRNNSALSVSNFNVGGIHASKGMKGFIYGERGVWRPGDNIYLTFILEDKQNMLPDNYPIRFELYNPLDQLIESRVLKYGENGFYSFVTKTSPEAITGNWYLKVNAGGAVFRKTVKIETIKPNRLKGNIYFGKELITNDDLSKVFRFKAQWLHGSPASNLKFDIKLKLFKTKTKFEKYQQYNFDNTVSDFSSEEIDITSGKLDENGEKDFSIDISTTNAPGFLKAVFTERIFEKGGDFSIITQKVKYSPYDNYAGMRMMSKGERGWYLINKNQKLGIITVDDKGNAAANRKVKVKIFKVRWRWWWNSYNEDLARYTTSKSVSAVIEKTLITGKDGKVMMNFKIPYNNYNDNGRYLITVTDVKSGHISASTVYFSEWYGSIGNTGETATMLSFNTDKDVYKTGEEINVVIPTSKNGRALVSVEKGSDILDVFWVKTTDKETRFTIPVKYNMAPNVYIHISLIQPHSQTVNDNPIRMYGVIPVKVTDEQTVLQPQIKTQKTFKPKKPFTVTVSEKNGKDMTYTLAIVDEGLLDITGFRTPDPHSYFYSREALTNRTWDMYDYVIGAYGARLEKAFAIGGGDNAVNPSKNKANRFKPVVIFDGPYTLKGGSSKVHKLTMPNYVGSVRVMVVAGNKGAYGNAEKAIPVKNDLMVLGTLPRVLGPGEEVVLPVTVFAMKKTIKNVTVTVSTNKLLKNTGKSSQRLHFKQTGEKLAYFSFKVPETTGKATVHITATDGDKKASYDIELDIRNPNPEYTVIKEKLLKKGESWNTTAEAIGVTGTNKGTVEISTVPPINLEKRLRYLIHYPYGCIEQTISSVFPQLYLKNIMDLKPEQSIEIQHNITSALERLRKFQLSNGSFSYWPGGGTTNIWGTNYAGHFLLAAKEKGYALPNGMLRKWLNFQKKAANNTTYYPYYGAYMEQAYRLYLLAKAGKPKMGAMNRLRENVNITERAKVLLAGAYALANQRIAAINLFEKQLRLKSLGYSNNFDYSYGSTTRDMAMKAMVMKDLGKQSSAFEFVKNISRKLSSNEWMSTQTTAMCLMAVSEFYNNTIHHTNAVIYINGKKTNISSTHCFVKTDIGLKQNNKKTIKIENKTNGVLYARIIVSGKPAEGEDFSKSDNLHVSVRYTDMKGKSIDPSKIKQGTDFKAIVTVNNPGYLFDYHDLALSQIFPSGWEILNERLFAISNSAGNSKADYLDIRDDRIYTFFSLKKHKTKTFTVLLNAAYQGRFYLPAVKCSAMYDNKIEAIEKGRWVEVTE